jgi:drug/metabolite transporter (DMT)-like permease
MFKKSLGSEVLLLLTSIIWGVAFVAQSMVTGTLGAYTFNAVRFAIGGLVLLPVIRLLNARKPAEEKQASSGKRSTLVLGGLLCGTALFTAAALQQLGMSDTSVGKAGFITALYIVIVPIIGIFVKRRPALLVWPAVALAALGLWYLSFSSIGEYGHIGKGDRLMLMCAFCFSVHILLIDRLSVRTDPVKLSCLQFFVCAALSAVAALIFEKPTMDSILKSWFPILYTGVLSSGVAYTLQIVGQRNTPPAIASLLMSLESVFAALSGWVILGQGMTSRELTGCLLMFSAIVLTQIPLERKRREVQSSHI